MSKVRIFALGGLDEDGKNMYVVENGNDIFVMDDRYNLFAAAGVRNIEVYNQKVMEQDGRPNEDGSP